MRMFKEVPKVDWLKLAPPMLVFSVLLTASGIIGPMLFGMNYGVDFAGGYEVQVKFPSAVDGAQITEQLQKLGIQDARVQRIGDASAGEYLVLVREHGTISDSDKVGLNAEAAVLAGGPDKLTNWSVAESGESVVVEFTTPVSEAQVRQLFEKRGIAVKAIHGGERVDQPEYTVTLVSLADKISKQLAVGLAVPEGHELVQRVEFVGPQVGSQLRSQGLMALAYALFFMLVYIVLRFDMFYAPGALLALVHDVLGTIGLFSILQLQFDLPIVAALLTIVGYSINDTIIIFDRVRENIVRMRGADLRTVVNTSINQTMSRTVLTGGTTMVSLLFIYLVGGEATQNFALAMICGVAFGTYSSFGVAAPIYVFLKERSAKKARISNPAVAA